MEHGLEVWHDFFVAEVGASATLAGLVIVAVSINLAHILKLAILLGRAAEALLYLGGAMVAASFGLIPQSAQWLGGELAILGALLWLNVLVIQLGALRSLAENRLAWTLPRFAFGLICTLPVCAAGILLYLSYPAAPYVLAAGILLSLAVGLTNAWVLLVEILR